MEKRTCAKCGASIDPPSGAGRPRRFCSTGCRRAAEFEARRLDRSLQALEAERQMLSRQRTETYLTDLCDPRTLDEKRADNGREIAEAEARLKTLLDEDTR